MTTDDIVSAFAVIIFCIILVAPFIVWYLYESSYFNGETFLAIKSRIQVYIDDCNNLNKHIAELKQIRLGTDKLNSGKSTYSDKSNWKFKRPEWKKLQYGSNIHNCSRTVCDGARREPFKYICKYFNIKTDEETLEKFESLLNNFEAAKDGKKSLEQERKRIMKSIQTDIPPLIRIFSPQKLIKKLGFDEFIFYTESFPRYIFKYVSPGGNSSTQCDIVLDIDNLNKFVVYLSDKIKFKKSVAGQRTLMTSKLRQKIKERDHFTCRKCGVSIAQEPHLLLEIDHIVPLSRGGLTTESNLQTLCWRCNRSKGAKI